MRKKPYPMRSFEIRLIDKKGVEVMVCAAFAETHSNALNNALADNRIKLPKNFTTGHILAIRDDFVTITTLISRVQ